MRIALLAYVGLVTLNAASCAGTARTDSAAPSAPVQTGPAAPTDGHTPPAPVVAVTNNPLIAEWTGPYGGVPPFDQVRPALFPAAFQAGINARRVEIQAITNTTDAATFANTFIPLQNSGRQLSRVNTLFSVMTSNVNSPEYQALDREWSPRLAAASDEITFNAVLFRRISAVHENRDRAGLTPEQQRLVERTYAQYVRAGAQLDAGRKEELGRINQQLAGLFSDFATKVLNDENTWIHITDEAQLAGLPESLRAAYRAAAEERALQGWAVVNTRSSVDPFLTFADDRALRERVWTQFKMRGDNNDANDTKATIAQIVRLRAERARLLGYESHAHWRMEDTMARDPERAMELMMRVWPAAVARVEEEVADMRGIALRAGRNITIEPWDYLYYGEQVRQERYDLDQNEVKPYFELNNMMQAAFWTAGQLYGLTFHEITGQLPAFHPDVRVYEVREGDRHVGLFYSDNFARTGKRSGAWASTYRGHETFTGEQRTPLSSNNNNFVKGAPGEPVLISRDDAETLFHEFGHALHTLLSEVNYPGLAVTPRDFVEYPSQVMEHWVLTRPVLDRFARHYQTDEPMPQELVDKIKASETFNQGYATTEYLSAALVDMMMHTRADGVVDAAAFERDALAEIGMPDQIALRHRLPHFNHLFTSDAYSAGYYSYLWSEVMDADTWQAFEESGNVFDADLAQRMRRYILAPGNTTDRAEAYRQFRGRDPVVEALLQVRGFPVTGRR
ncbi:MAG: M3 family metallopeptidase [Gemmatimonadetes bacterium]|nr:M3 family metallopeptidase [Gemmatimonadota bacterium]